MKSYGSLKPISKKGFTYSVRASIQRQPAKVGLGPITHPGQTLKELLAEFTHHWLTSAALFSGSRMRKFPLGRDQRQNIGSICLVPQQTPYMTTRGAGANSIVLMSTGVDTTRWRTGPATLA